MPKTTPKECLAAIDKFLQGMQRQRDIVEAHDDSESSMSEESRALPRFFNVVLPELEKQFPELVGSSSGAKDAEDAAIKEIIDEIQKRLAECIDRSGKKVGAKSAAEAVALASKRQLRSLVTVDRDGGDKVSFDEIGRLHTALRALFCDNNLTGEYLSQYLDGRSGYQYRGGVTRSYRRLLALIWKGATEHDFEPSVAGMSHERSTLQALAREAVITEIAQNRREHNWDEYPLRSGRRPYGAILQDRQTCGIGLRGRMFGRMLMYNERYVKSKSSLNTGKLNDYIHDYISEQFKKLSLKDRTAIANYYEERVINDDIPNDLDALTLEKFIVSIEDICFDVVMSTIQKSPLFTAIKDILLDMERRDGRALIAFTNLIHDYVKSEVDSLRYRKDNPAPYSLIKQFEFGTISSNFENLIKCTTSALPTEFEGYYAKLSRKIKDYSYVVNGEHVRRSLSKSYAASKKAQLKKSNLISQLEAYKIILAEFKASIDKAVHAAGQEAQAKVKEHFMFASQMSKDAMTSEKSDKLFKDIHRKIDKVAKKIERLLEVLASDNEKYSSLRWGIREYIAPLSGDDTQPAIVLARYAWAIVNEKSKAKHFFINSKRAEGTRDELDKILEIVFGDGKDITGLSAPEQQLFLYEINDYKSKIQSKELECRWSVLKTRVQEKSKVDLSRSDLVPQRNFYTLKESSHAIAMLGSRGLNSYFESSEVRELLEKRFNTRSSERILRDSSIYDMAMLQEVAQLKLSTKKVGQRAISLKLWCSAIKAILDKHGKLRGKSKNLSDARCRDLLVHLTCQTLMLNLKITEFTRGDKQVISQLVDQYLGYAQHDNFPLPFDDAFPRTSTGKDPVDIDSRITNFANHLSIVIRMLKGKTIKNAFSKGIVRLLSRKDAAAEIGSGKRYVLRLSNLKPNQIVLSYGTGEFFHNVYLSSAKTDKFSITDSSGSKVMFDTLAMKKNELNKLVKSKIDVTTIKPIVTDRSLDEIESEEFQSQASSAYQDVSSSVVYAIATPSTSGEPRVESDSEEESPVLTSSASTLTAKPKHGFFDSLPKLDSKTSEREGVEDTSRNVYIWWEKR